MSNEIKILKEFIKEFNPSYSPKKVNNCKYFELVELVKETVKEM